MSLSQNTPSKKKFAWIPVLLVAGVALILVTAGGFGFAASMESKDAFCASCHTQPETTFYQNSIAAHPGDLASFHTTQNTNCIDCHSGPGITGRIQAELMGVHNALKWYTGTAVQPAVLSSPFPDENCLKCHQDVVARGFSPKEQITVPGGEGGGREGEGGNNHWHQQLAKWQSSSATAGTCTSCHSGHATGTTAQTGFMNPQNVAATCDACHQVLRREGGG